jgi:hypothetical protein
MYVSTSSEIRSDARKRAVGLINDNKERHKIVLSDPLLALQRRHRFSILLNWNRA